MMKIVSPIAIDMGAKNTGVYLNHFMQGEDPTTSGNIEGMTIVVDGSGITWSQVSRTQKRHQVRSNKRRKLSKRLLRVILQRGYELPIERKQVEFLMGLLNRRGYNRIEVTPEQEEALMVKGVTDFLYPLLFEGQAGCVSLLDALSNQVIIKDQEGKEFWQHTLQDEMFSKQGRQNKRFEDLKNKYQEKDENKISDLSKALTAVKNIIQKQIDNYDTGHLHRKDYLENVRKDVECELLNPLLKGNFTAEKLSNLIGHISNLQLRILRKYFNDENMKTGDQWKPEKFSELFFKWICSWHCKQDDEKSKRKELLALKGKKSILDILTTSCPELTIPPYEDQNNRRPPKDLTLRLRPGGLDRVFPDWESITRLLSDNYCLPIIEPNIVDVIAIQYNLGNNVRVQKESKKTQSAKERQILADTLHRILDRSIVLDPYKLRWNSEGSQSPEAQEAKEILNTHSENQADAICDFAVRYYDEVDTVKQGLWSNNERSLFFRCNTNPPHKNKIQHNLISHILGEDMDKAELRLFMDKCWTGKKVGRSTIRGIAKTAEEERKKYGNRFNQLVRRQIWLREQSDRELDNKNEHGVDGKIIIDIYDRCLKAADVVADYFKHDDKKKKIYANIFSFTQLYNILETQIQGFSRTDRWNTIENSWRSKKEYSWCHKEKRFCSKGNAVANGVRLTADSIRPFDGMLDRIISRQAYEISKLKIDQIGKIGIDEHDEVFVPILMEQNRFKFEQNMHDIKGKNTISKKTQVRIGDGLERQTRRWRDKDSRIKSNTRCPYTGEKIGRGEIDHIIPQSQSKNQNDVVFNSEANLVYCSSDGNHKKGDARWNFDRLHVKYLEEIFGNADREKIKREIRDYVKGIDENSFSGFHNLEAKKQNYLRHALFMPELDNITFLLLNTRNKTLVNGTQGYLGKQIRKFIHDKYPNIVVKTYQIEAQEVSQLRISLGDYDAKFAKHDKQSPFSHVIDASLVLAAALQNQKIVEELKTTNVAQLSEQGEWLKNLVPNQTGDSIRRIERKWKHCKDKNLSSTKIFKEGLYGERFIPILLDGKKILCGFELKNSVEFNLKKITRMKNVKEFNEKLKEIRGKELNEQNLYVFETLKPFLRLAGKPVMGSLTDLQERVQISNRPYMCLVVNKVAALEHLQKCVKQTCDLDAVEKVVLLESLRYSVEKKKIKDVVLPGRGTRKFIKSLDGVKLELLARLRLPNKLALPAKCDWERLIRQPINDYFNRSTTLKECFGKDEKVEIDNPKLEGFWISLARDSGLSVDYLKVNLLKKKSDDKNETIISKNDFDEKIATDEELAKVKDSDLLKGQFGVGLKVKEDLIPQASWDQLFYDFFHLGKVKNTSFHKARRKDYSLPVVSNPSGRFRVKRSNPISGETVYQVSAIADGGHTYGFAKRKDGSIDLSEEGRIFNQELTSSRNVAYIGMSGKPHIFTERDSNDVEPLRTSREVKIDCEDVLKCYLTLAESSRIDIKIFVAEEKFMEIVKFSGMECSQARGEIFIVFRRDDAKEIAAHDEFEEIFKGKKLKNKKRNTLIPMPRNIGNRGKWRYKLNCQVDVDKFALSYSTNMSSDLKNAYQNGVLVKNG